MSNPNQETIPARSGASDTLPGLRLRQAREQAGLTVAEAANQLRLRSHLLDAIEREDLAALGAPVFARGYIDSYVRLLGLPGNWSMNCCRHRRANRSGFCPARA